jgi:hypothetical protein
MAQTPSVGRIVHYVSYGTPGGEYPSVCRAAIVAGIPDAFWQGDAQPVDLVVLNPTGLFFNNHCAKDEADHRGGTWHWPERVE